MKKQISINNLLTTLTILLLICMITLEIHRFRLEEIVRVRIYKAFISNENAINQAIKDINKGEKYILLRGLRGINKDEAEERIKEEKEYSFKYISLGCVSERKYSSIYDQIMRRYISEKAQKKVFWTFDIFTLKEMKKASSE